MDNINEEIVDGGRKKKDTNEETSKESTYIHTQTHTTQTTTPHSSLIDIIQEAKEHTKK